MRDAVRRLALTFDVDGSTLVGIVTTPVANAAAARATMGLLIVVGGPQYRVGSHRQFALLADAVAAGGIPVMRFDFSGMGDSAGVPASFSERDAEIRAAVDAFLAAVPGLDRVALWGLCDGASAAMIYAPTDPRVERMVLVNPWVRSEEGLARTHLKHHYLKVVFGADFWRRLLTGRVDVKRSASELLSTWRRARVRGESGSVASFQTRMARGWKRFHGDILLICSGDDLTAREFEDRAATDREWTGLLAEARVTRRSLIEADHTFSTAPWRDQVAAWTREWLAGASSTTRGPLRPGDPTPSPDAGAAARRTGPGLERWGTRAGSGSDR